MSDWRNILSDFPSDSDAGRVECRGHFVGEEPRHVIGWMQLEQRDCEGEMRPVLTVRDDAGQPYDLVEFSEWRKLPELKA
jgi:hypothetical protein